MKSSVEKIILLLSIPFTIFSPGRALGQETIFFKHAQFATPERHLMLSLGSNATVELRDVFEVDPFSKDEVYQKTLVFCTYPFMFQNLGSEAVAFDGTSVGSPRLLFNDSSWGINIQFYGTVKTNNFWLTVLPSEGIVLGTGAYWDSLKFENRLLAEEFSLNGGCDIPNEVQLLDELYGLVKYRFETDPEFNSSPNSFAGYIDFKIVSTL